MKTVVVYTDSIQVQLSIFNNAYWKGVRMQEDNHCYCKKDFSAHFHKYKGVFFTFRYHHQGKRLSKNGIRKNGHSNEILRLTKIQEIMHD